MPQDKFWKEVFRVLSLYKQRTKKNSESPINKNNEYVHLQDIENCIEWMGYKNISNKYI